MGYPATDLLEAATTRNKMDDVERFLVESFGPGRCRVYNLCSEADRDYDRMIRFGGNCARFGFPDHNAPTLALMHAFCEDAAEHLSAHPANSVAIHCKAGKGRTGTMVAALLLHLGEFSSAEAALRWYGKQRTHNGKGVTIPSQRRAVGYYSAWLRGPAASNPLVSVRGAIGSGSGSGTRLLERPKGVLLERMRVHTIPHFDADGGCDPYYIIHTGEFQAGQTGSNLDVVEQAANMKTAQQGVVRNQPAGGVGYFDLDCLALPVKGSVKVSRASYTT